MTTEKDSSVECPSCIQDPSGKPTGLIHDSGAANCHYSSGREVCADCLLTDGACDLHSSGRAEPDAISPDVSAVMEAVFKLIAGDMMASDALLTQDVEQAVIAACEAWAQQKIAEGKGAWPIVERVTAERDQIRIAAEITTELLHTAEAERDEAQRDARTLAETLREYVDTHPCLDGDGSRREGACEAQGRARAALKAHDAAVGHTEAP